MDSHHINNDLNTESSATVYHASKTVRLLGSLILCILPIMIVSSTPPSLLAQVQRNGFIQMLSINGPSTIYEGPFGDAGFEYELANAFAESLGVELAVTTKDNINGLLNAMPTTNAHFAAAGLSITKSRTSFINFTTPYTAVSQIVIYQRDSTRPQTVDDLLGKDIIVANGSSHIYTLRKLQEDYPDLQWREVNAEMSDLLEAIHNGNADISIVDSTAFTTNRVVYPRARLGFVLTEPEKIAWAFPKQGDNSLLKTANIFLADAIESGFITSLEEKYFSRPTLDESNALTLSERIEERLPQWEPLFKATAEKYDMDWLFLAAISYQESFWNQNAKSYTGVRGLMMLTQRTAKGLGIEDRTDPQQSIDGGARYFLNMTKRLPESIQQPDRTWMALAAYNIGLGHLEDARVITQRQGGDPNRWDDVRTRLPLLTKPKYYRQTRHGYARGWEPVSYVKRIRNYHNILIWYYDNLRRNNGIAESDNRLSPIDIINDSAPQL